MNKILSFIRLERKNILAGIGVGVVITFLFAGFNLKLESVLLNFIYGALVGLSIALGCGAISRRMFGSDIWLEKPVKHYMSAILLIGLYILADVIILNLIWFKITQNVNPSKLFQNDFFQLVLLIEFVAGLIVYLIILSRNFAKNLNSYYLQSQESEQELSRYRFETLKNQVNPHFLFNSLNVLSGIIYKDIKLADEFIQHLSRIYRYVLDIQEEDIVELKQELIFTEDYLYLLKLRFGDMFDYKINVKSNGYVVPMALQTLLENAVKHNSMQTDKVLHIIIDEKDEYVIVRNNRNKMLSEHPSSGLGLENIKSRYSYLSEKKVEIRSSGEWFEVWIPILKQSSAQ